MNESNLSMNEQINKQIMWEYLYLKINLPPEKKYIYILYNLRKHNSFKVVMHLCLRSATWPEPDGSQNSFGLGSGL